MKFTSYYYYYYYKNTATSGKKHIVYELLSQPHNHLRHGKLKNTTHKSNQRLTAPLNPSNVLVSNTVMKGGRPIGQGT